MKKVDMSRDVVREAVIASMYKQSDDTAARERRLCRLAGLPYDPKNGIKTQAVMSFIVEPYVNNIMGLITDDEFLEQLKGILREYVDSQVMMAYPDEEGISIFPEENRRIRQKVGEGITNVLNNLITYILPLNYLEISDKYWKCVFDLAREKGIDPKDIFFSDELYKEVLRRVYSREEYKAAFEKIGTLFDFDTLFELVFKPVLRSIAESEEDAAKLFDKVKEEARLDPEFQIKMRAAKNGFFQLIAEEIESIYG